MRARSSVPSMRFAVLVVVGAVLLVGCSADTELTTTTRATTTSVTSPNPFGCVPAPEQERHSYSAFPLAINDNPVVAGSGTRLRIGTPTTIDRDPVGKFVADDLGSTDLGAKWQCWTGAEWVETHVLMLDGETITGAPGVTTTTLAIGRQLPGSFSVVIPDVVPGWYRIAVRTGGPEPYGSDSFERHGYVAIEVTG